MINALQNDSVEIQEVAMEKLMLKSFPPKVIFQKLSKIQSSMLNNIPFFFYFPSLPFIFISLAQFPSCSLVDFLCEGKCTLGLFC